MLLDEDAEDDHGEGDDRADGGLRAVEASLDGALELVQQHRQGGHLRLGEGERQQELAPVEDEDEEEGHHHPRGDQGQDDAPQRVQAPGAHDARGVLQGVGHLLDEVEHHPDDERQGGRHVQQAEPQVGVEQAHPHAQQQLGGVRDQHRVVHQDGNGNDDGRHHADGEDHVAKVLAAHVEARNRIRQERAQQQRRQGADRGDGNGVADRLPDVVDLLGRLAAGRRRQRPDGHDLPVVVQGRLVRQPVRRPGDPLARALEGRRDHPEDRKQNDQRPPDQDGVPEIREQPPAPCLGARRPCRVGRRHHPLPSDCCRSARSRTSR